MDFPTHYELLCVTPEATADEIRSAYRRLIRVYHPDLTNAAGDAMTRRLNDAQRVLLDARLRGDYDRAMRARLGASASRHTAPPSSSYQSSSHRGSPSQPASSAHQGSSAHAGSAEYTRPRAQPRPRQPWSARRYTAWGILSLVSIAAILTSTVIVFALSYAGSAGFLGDPTMSNPRVIPPLVIALVWLVAATRRANPFLVALLVIGATLWPLALVPVEPFGWLQTSLSPQVLPLLTLAALAVIGYRIATPRFARLLQTRPQPAASRPRQPAARPASPAFRS